MTRRTNKIILTGYRATGKSTVGRLLAARLGFEFLDLDEEIVRRAGRSIREMVATYGWEYFRDLERQALRDLVERDRVVVATGGGAILHREAWQALKKTGLVVWLTADLATIGQRLRADQATAAQRPSLTGQDVLTEVAAVLAERQPLYQAGSHLTIDTATLSAEQAAATIVRALEAEDLASPQ